MQRTILFGLFAAGLSSWILFFGVSTGQSSTIISTPSEKTGLIIVLLFLLYLWAIKDRKKKQEGFLEFSEGIQTGIVVTIVNCILFGIASYIFFSWYVPNDTMQEGVQNFFKSRRADAAGFRAWLEEFNPFILSVMALVFMAVLGAVYTFLISLFLKKSPEKL